METATAPVSKKMLWIGRIISALPVLFLAGGGIFGLMKPAMVEENLSRLGYPAHVARAIIIVEIACAVVYAIPQTTVLGAILLTGYLGGATATHVRIGEPFFVPVIFGMVVWLGLYLRDERVRALLPLRS